MKEVISKVGLVDFKSCWSVIRENGISKFLEWNNALLEVISKVGLVDLIADNPKVKPAVVKEKSDDVTSKSESNEIQSESHEIQSESHGNAIEFGYYEHSDGIHHEEYDGDDDDEGGNGNDNC
nr:hypothetical protein [Tanacetum cinerariifolium]